MAETLEEDVMPTGCQGDRRRCYGDRRGRASCHAEVNSGLTHLLTETVSTWKTHHLIYV